MVLELAGLEVPELGIGVPVLPEDLHLGLLNVRAVRAGGVHLHDGDGDGAPGIVLHGDQGLPVPLLPGLGRGPREEHAVLGREA